MGFKQNITLNLLHSNIKQITCISSVFQNYLSKVIRNEQNLTNQMINDNSTIDRHQLTHIERTLYCVFQTSIFLYTIK